WRAMVGVTRAQMTGWWVAGWALLPMAGNMAALVVTLGLTPLMLIFGEVIPKAVAREWATAFILRLFGLVELASTLLAPLTWLANAVVAAVLAAFGRRRGGPRQFLPPRGLQPLLPRGPAEAGVATARAGERAESFG